MTAATLNGVQLRLPYEAQRDRHAGTVTVNEAAVESFVSLYCDSDDERLVELLHSLVRPDLTHAELMERLSGLCARSQDVAELEDWHRGSVEAYEAARDEYIAFLRDFALRRSEVLTALMDAIAENNRPSLEVVR